MKPHPSDLAAVQAETRDLGGNVEVPSRTSNCTVERDILAEVIAQGAPSRLATILWLSSLTATITGAK